ncbi:MAG: hypothetical protein WA705_13835, partial [Candidatus Ozemobacteraceae bacterium]
MSSDIRGNSPLPPTMLLLVWFFAAALPMLMLRTSLEGILAREEEDLHAQGRSTLMEEMGAFRKDLQIRESMTTRLREIDRKYGFERRFENSSSPPLKPIEMTLLPVLAKDLRDKIGVDPVALFLFGPDGEQLVATFPEKYGPQPPIDTLTYQHLLAIIINIATIDISAGPLKTVDALSPDNAGFKIKWQNIASDDLKRRFGSCIWGNFEARSIATFYTEKFGTGRILFYLGTSVQLPEHGSGKLLGAYLTAFFEPDVSQAKILQNALTKSRFSGFKRRFRFNTRLSSPRFLSRRHSLAFQDVVPIEGLHLEPRKDRLQTVDALPPILEVTAPPSFFRHPLRKFFPVFSAIMLAIAIGGGLFILRLHLKGGVMEINLGGKLLAGVSLGVLLPLTGFLFAGVSESRFRDRLSPEIVQDHMTTHLNSFERGMNDFQSFLSARMLDLKRRLEPSIDASPEAIRALLQEWVLEARRLSGTSNILYVSRALTFVRSDGLEIFVPDNPLYKVENNTLMKIERDLAAEKLFLLNGYSSRSQAEQTRERTRIDLMHSVLDSLIGQSWISGLFKQDATFSNVPFNSKTQLYSTITHRRPKTGEVVATVIFKYFAQGLSHSFLASMLADPGQFQGTL